MKMETSHTESLVESFEKVRDLPRTLARFSEIVMHLNNRSQQAAQYADAALERMNKALARSDIYLTSTNQNYRKKTLWLNKKQNISGESGLY